MPAPPTVPRRTLLISGLGAGAVALAGSTALAGCQLRVGSPGDGASPPASGSSGSSTPAPDADTAVDTAALTVAANGVQVLQHLYALAGQVRPDLASPLAALDGDHAVQLRALRQIGAQPGSPTATPSTPAPTSASALSTLAQSERLLASSLRLALAPASGQVARLLASVAACGDAHVALLARLPATPSSGTA